MLGQLLDGRYKIVQSLGACSFGHTYVALDTKLFYKKCVVKQLKPLTTDPKTLKIAKRLFDSEAQLLHRLGIHDQIPQLQAHFQENPTNALPNLEFAEIESEAICRIFPNHQHISSNDATKEALKTNLPQKEYNIFHFTVSV
ncbi:serine/threonine kinase [Calothrix sp. NIES-4071]|nr:serine/threonine kinase [Calothrix sp. NIES-4071]BAZ57163.1 serine/threonine kinase [Calothrix sp. NIES-4105]